MRTTNLNLLFVLVLIAGIGLSGCGKKDQTQQQTNPDNKQQDVKTTDPKKDDASKDNTQKDSKNELGIKEGIPGDYPSDVPQPTNSKCLGSLATSEGTVVTFESTDKPKDILTPFTDALAKSGYKKGEGEMMSDDGGMSMWTKDKKEVSIMLAWDKDKKTSSVVVTYK